MAPISSIPERAIRRAAILVGLSILSPISACGGGEAAEEGATVVVESSEPAPDSEENDPCALVTGAEADEVLAAAAEMERPPEANNEYLATCSYVAPRGAGVAVLVVKVSRKSGTAGFENARRMDEAGFELQPVSGVGDQALWVGDPLNTLYVLSDTVYLDVGGDVQLEQARTLALRAVERLRQETPP